nr:uncharacterized protein LOC127315279 [Lolium perenne]
MPRRTRSFGLAGNPRSGSLHPLGIHSQRRSWAWARSIKASRGPTDGEATSPRFSPPSGGPSKRNGWCSSSGPSSQDGPGPPALVPRAREPSAAPGSLDTSGSGDPRLAAPDSPPFGVEGRTTSAHGEDLPVREAAPRHRPSSPRAAPGAEGGAHDPQIVKAVPRAQRSPAAVDLAGQHRPHRRAPAPGNHPRSPGRRDDEEASRRKRLLLRLGVSCAPASSSAAARGPPSPEPAPTLRREPPGADAIPHAAPSGGGRLTSPARSGI